jgi:hypothetical protein
MNIKYLYYDIEQILTNMNIHIILRKCYCLIIVVYVVHLNKIFYGKRYLLSCTCLMFEYFSDTM